MARRNTRVTRPRHARLPSWMEQIEDLQNAPAAKKREARRAARTTKELPPTWDWIDASIMSVLTFATAPWAMVVFYGLRRRTPPLWKLYVAFVLAMLSASWSYDGYLLIHDGFYPASWLENAIASMVLYVSAGLFWSVDGHSVRKVVFVFTLERSFEEAENSFSGYMLAIAAPFAFLVTYLLSIFLPELS